MGRGQQAYSFSGIDFGLKGPISSFAELVFNGNYEKLAG